MPKRFDPKAAVRELSKQDVKLAGLIKRVGSFELKVARKQTPYQSLIRSIVFQQLNGKAAATIHKRVQGLYGDRDPSPAELLATDDAALAGAGLSRQKRAALKDLALNAQAGRIPDRRAMSKMTDEEIIAQLIQVKGIGKWTVEMLLIFSLGRRDVLAVDDFAIKKSTMILYGLKSMPNRKKMTQIGEKWRPWRSIACWYLWRALDK